MNVAKILVPSAVNLNYAFFRTLFVKLPNDASLFNCFVTTQETEIWVIDKSFVDTLITASNTIPEIKTTYRVNAYGNLELDLLDFSPALSSIPTMATPSPWAQQIANNHVFPGPNPAPPINPLMVGGPNGYVVQVMDENGWLRRLMGEPGCSHTWIPYEGLLQKYDFCSKCDKKKDS